MTHPEYYNIPEGWDDPEKYWAWKESRQEACFHAGLAGLDVTGDAHYIEDFQPLGLGNDERSKNMGGQAHVAASVDEDGTATAEATAPAANTSADESSTPDETASSDSE